MHLIKNTCVALRKGHGFFDELLRNWVLKRAWRCLFLLYAPETRSRARVRIIGIYCNVTITIIISVWQIPIIRTTPVPLWGPPWCDEASVIWYNRSIISMLSYKTSCLASQVWARGITKKDTCMLYVEFLSCITLERSAGVICWVLSFSARLEMPNCVFLLS